MQRCIISVPKPIRLQFYTQDDVEAALEHLKRQPQYTEKLHSLDIDRLAPAFKLFGGYFSDPLEPSGEVPEILQDFAGVSSGANSIQLYLNSEGEALELIRYLSKNGGWALRPTQQDGNCMYSALRRGLDIPAEFTNTHLRRFLVIYMGLKYPQFFFSLLKGQIADTYGQQRFSAEELQAQEDAGLAVRPSMLRDQSMPGPFSYREYLQYVLSEGTWGDEIILCVFSLLTQTAITVIRTDTKRETRIRHTRDMADVDLILLHGGLVHYSGTGKSLSLLVYFLAQRWLNAPKRCISLHAMTYYSGDLPDRCYRFFV